MSIAPPGLVVPGPKAPIPPKYGLLSTIEPEILEDQHAWAGGVEWEFDLCTTLEGFTDQCPPASFTKSTERDLEFCHADPFIVKSSFKCSTAGRSVSEAIQIAKRRLLAWESHKVEEIFWTGTTANGQINPSLAFGNDTCDLPVIDLTPTVNSVISPVSVLAGIASIEEALTDVVPGGGVIHVPYGLAGYLNRYHLSNFIDGKYYSSTGFPIVIGSGYPGSGPGNVVSDPGTTWIFATGPMIVWQSDYFLNPSEVSEGIERYRNDVTVFAERFFMVGYSCAVYSVLVCI